MHQYQSRTFIIFMINTNVRIGMFAYDITCITLSKPQNAKTIDDRKKVRMTSKPVRQVGLTWTERQDIEMLHN